jgi:hypothetical protein
MLDEKWEEVKLYARNRFRADFDTLQSKREGDRNELAGEELARGFGLILDPLDPRFDRIEIEHRKAVLAAQASAWFEAYNVHRLVPDDRLWQELCRFREDSLAATAMSLRQTATGRANRMGMNSAPGIARADALARKLRRSAHEFLKSIRCKITARQQESRPRFGFGAAGV